jgi:MOSC domain-containing protein YiiM
MKVLSVNVGLPVDITVGDKIIQTGIFKKPVSGPVRVRSLNMDGDRQADLTVHGGVDQAVYVYSSEHYRVWEHELGRAFPEWGTFGENLTIEGTLEEDICVGDTIEIGTVIFQVTQPRLPCFKLAAKLERDDIIKRLLDSRRTGFYTRVLQEGFLMAGDLVTINQRDPHHLTIREFTDVYLMKPPDRLSIERILSVKPLSSGWRRYFEGLLHD